MTNSTSTRPFMKTRTLTSADLNSFVDIQLKSSSSVIKVTSESKTGYETDKAYTSVLTIGGSAKTITVSGSDTATIADLTSKINIALSGTATATFVETEKVIRIQANASGATAFVVTDSGSLMSGIVGDKVQGLTATYGTPCVGGGVNFQLSNTATASNQVYAGYVVQAYTSAGVDIAVTRTYDSATGVLQIKKASGSFSATDTVTVVGNLF